jgi:hypothetical protein
MAEAIDLYGSAFKNGSITLLARVVGPDGDPIVQADIQSAKYSVYLLDNHDPDSRTAVDGHGNVTLPVGQLIFDTLQVDAIWTIDPVGYNFRHVLDVSAHPAFAVADRRYLVEHRLTPVAGQVIVVRFQIHVI